MSMVLQRFMNLPLIAAYCPNLEITMLSNSLRLDYSVTVHPNANLLLGNDRHVLLLVRRFLDGLQEGVVVNGVPLLQQLLHHRSARVARLLRPASNAQWILFHVILVRLIILGSDHAEEREE